MIKIISLLSSAAFGNKISKDQLKNTFILKRIDTRNKIHDEVIKKLLIDFKKNFRPYSNRISWISSHSFIHFE